MRYNSVTPLQNQEEIVANWNYPTMKIFLIVWLILGLVVAVFVIAALIRSSQISQQNGLSESYDEWQVKESARERYPRQVEQP